MHNRGNGKGGGLAAVGLVPAMLGVDQKTLDEAFLLQIAIIDESILPEMEARFIRPHFNVAHEAFIETIDDYRDISGLEVKPPAGETLFCPCETGSPGSFPEGAASGNAPYLTRQKKNLSIRIPID